MLAVALLAAPQGINAAQDVGLTEVAAGLASPVELTTSDDGLERLYVVEQAGRIRIVEGGALRPAPFLDISSRVLSGGERGLLGLAFHPQYAANRAFYVYYTRAQDGAIVLARYLRDEANDATADPASEMPLLVIPHPIPNHNGGKIAFGRDGRLYIGTGDGGGAGDPLGNGQNLRSLLGKILRISVEGGPAYSVPPDNPFAGSSCAAGACPEIWAYGLRNPWKFSFDRLNGDMFIGDVGQGAWEEVDYLPSGASGRNFGWNFLEGNHCFSQPCQPVAAFWGPVIEYPHNAANGFSVTGGFRYRGSRIPFLSGRLIYGDFVTGRVWSSTQNAAGSWSSSVLIDPPSPLGTISSFGEDERGELYVLDYSAGKLWRMDYPLAAAPGSVFFGNQPLGVTSSPVRIVLSNNGSMVRTIGIASIAVEGSPSFAVQASTCGASIGIGATCFVDVIFAPTTPGAKHANLVVTTDLPAGPLRVGMAGNRNAGAVRDFNADGRDDVLWRNALGGGVVAWLMDGPALQTGALITSVDAGWQIAGHGDFDGDGRGDVLWRHVTAGAVVVWLMNGTAVRTGAFVSTVGPEWQIAGTGDFDGDGRGDVLWRHAAGGHVVVWLMNGTAIRTGAFVSTVGTEWQIAGTGDFNGDGRSDVLWRHTLGGHVVVWLMNGGALQSGAFVNTVDPLWRIVGTGDFNADGRSDILWRHDTAGHVSAWLMDGVRLQAQVLGATVSDLAWSVAGTGDLNGDGRSDLLWRNRDTGANQVWLSNGQTVSGVGNLPNVPAPAWAVAP